MEFFVGKVYLLENLINSQSVNSKSKFDFLTSSLMNSKEITIRKSSYKFLEAKTATYNGVNFIYGELIKYRDQETEVIDSIGNKTKIINKNEIVGNCFFIIESKENRIFYTESGSNITNITFLEKFNSIINWDSNSPYSIDVRSVNEKNSFLSTIKKLEKITTLEFNIVPTNPDPSRTIKKVDERLKKNHIKRLTEKYEGTREGLILDRRINEIAIFVDKGYGTGKATGEDKNGKAVTLSSRKAINQKKITINSSKVNILNFIENLFTKIF